MLKQLCCGVAAAVVALHPVGAQDASLERLTVPAQTLGNACAVIPHASGRLADGRVEGGLWAGLPIDRNPWSGDEGEVLAGIRARMLGPAPAPDGPPLDARRARAYLLATADLFAAGYAAFYRTADAEPVSVFALTFRDATTMPATTDRLHSPRAWSARWFRHAGTLALLTGPQGPCFDAVAAHLHAAMAER